MIPTVFINYTLKLQTIKNHRANHSPSKKKTERTGIPGLEPGREEVIAAGTLIIRCIMEELRQDQCLVSEYGLREGCWWTLLENLAGKIECKKKISCLPLAVPAETDGFLVGK